jgi:hypothetical protein
MLLIAPTRQNDTFPHDGLAATGAAERRRGLRIRQNRPVKVFDATAGRYFGGQTCDVSSTGLKIELPPGMPVKAGKVITIHVGLSEAGQPLANRRAMIPAKIVWVDRGVDHRTEKPRLTAGVEFVANIAAHLDAA